MANVWARGNDISTKREGQFDNERRCLRSVGFYCPKVWFLQGCLIKMPLRAIRVRKLPLRLLVERKVVAHFVTFGC
jgi:hypothetical protein